MFIDELPLNGHTKGALKRDGRFITIKALLEASRKELSFIPGIGKISLIDIEDALLPIRKKSIEFDLSDFLSKIEIIVRDITYIQFNKIELEINNFRTIFLELYRLVETIQLESRPEGIVNKINETIPGFSKTIYDLYEKLTSK